MEKNFRGAWNRIRTIFAQTGVTNVIWLWNPSGVDNSFYPGPNEVDWTGTDAYDYSSRGFYATLNYAYDGLAPLGKPILIGETGTHSGEQGAFFNTAVSELTVGNNSNNNPGLGMPDYLGFMYFDSPGSNSADWPIVTSPPSPGATAYAAMVKQPINPQTAQAYMSAMNVDVIPYTTYAFDTYVHLVAETLQGPNVTVKVTVDPLYGSSTIPTGQVTIYDGPNPVATRQLSCSGLPCMISANIPISDGRLTAVYSQGNYPQGQSGVIVVNPN